MSIAVIFGGVSMVSRSSAVNVIKGSNSDPLRNYRGTNKEGRWYLTEGHAGEIASGGKIDPDNRLQACIPADRRYTGPRFR